MLDEIKSGEQARVQELIDKSNLAKEQEIDELKNQINEMGGMMNEVVPAIKKVRDELEGYKKELGLYRERYGGRHFTKEERKKIEEFRGQMNTLPDYPDVST
jgi:uncharacterized coiled-coil DUF342 family protein